VRYGRRGELRSCVFCWGTFGQVRLGELMLVVFGCVAVSSGEAGKVSYVTFR